MFARTNSRTFINQLWGFYHCVSKCPLLWNAVGKKDDISRLLLWLISYQRINKCSRIGTHRAKLIYTGFFGFADSVTVRSAKNRMKNRLADYFQRLCVRLCFVDCSCPPCECAVNFMYRCCSLLQWEELMLQSALREHERMNVLYEWVNYG